MVVLNLNLVGSDAKSNTACQRTWINKYDAAISATEDLHIDNTKEVPVPNVDNELSLNLDSKFLFYIRREKFSNFKKQIL
jgi:hypothetical protein